MVFHLMWAGLICQFIAWASDEIDETRLFTPDYHSSNLVKIFWAWVIRMFQYLSCYVKWCLQLIYVLISYKYKFMRIYVISASLMNINGMHYTCVVCPMVFFCLLHMPISRLGWWKGNAWFGMRWNWMQFVQIELTRLLHVWFASKYINKNF